MSAVDDRSGMTSDTTVLLEAIGDLSDRIEQVHTLVNSNLTNSMRSELDATVREAAMMREVIAIKKAAGHDPSTEANKALELTDLRIEELRVQIEDKNVATEIAEAELRDD